MKLFILLLFMLSVTVGYAQKRDRTPGAIQCVIVDVKWYGWKKADVKLLTNGKGVMDTIVFPYRYSVRDHTYRPKYRIGDKCTLFVDSAGGKPMMKAVLLTNN